MDGHLHDSVHRVALEVSYRELSLKQPFGIDSQPLVGQIDIQTRSMGGGGGVDTRSRTHRHVLLSCLWYLHLANFSFQSCFFSDRSLSNRAARDEKSVTYAQSIGYFKRQLYLACWCHNQRLTETDRVFWETALQRSTALLMQHRLVYCTCMVGLASSSCCAHGNVSDSHLPRTSSRGHKAIHCNTKGRKTA